MTGRPGNSADFTACLGKLKNVNRSVKVFFFSDISDVLFSSACLSFFPFLHMPVENGFIFSFTLFCMFFEVLFLIYLETCPFMGAHYVRPPASLIISSLPLSLKSRN